MIPVDPAQAVVILFCPPTILEIHYRVSTFQLLKIPKPNFSSFYGHPEIDPQPILQHQVILTLLSVSFVYFWLKIANSSFSYRNFNIAWPWKKKKRLSPNSGRTGYPLAWNLVNFERSVQTIFLLTEDYLYTYII